MVKNIKNKCGGVQKCSLVISREGVCGIAEWRLHSIFRRAPSVCVKTAAERKLKSEKFMIFEMKP
jgi:hypothetical protein